MEKTMPDKDEVGLTKDGEKVDYASRVERMVSRWAGERGPPRPKASLCPTEEVLSRRDGVSEGREGEEGAVVYEPRRSVEVLERAEVLVVGGGPAGLSAALAARRAGADVLLVERFGCLGGVITTVGMETLGWYRYEGCANDAQGIGREMERVAAALGGTRKFPYNDSQCLDADFFKVVADELVAEAGVRVLLHTSVVEVVMEGERLKGVVTESKSGRKALLAEVVVDCSGDADVAWLAGAPVRKTPKEEAMGLTQVFNAAGVQREAFLEYTERRPATYADWSSGGWEQETTGKEDALRSPYLQDQFAEAKASGDIPEDSPAIAGSWSSLTEAGEATNLNLAHLYGLDPTDVRDLTKGEIQGRKQAMLALKALKSQVPGFEKARLRNFGMTLGVRDSRKIIGRYNLSAEDVREQGRFEDSIGIFPEFVDGYSILILPTSGRYFEVPLGCLVPLGVEGLLVGGRCVAGDKTSHCAMRNMMACTVSGQGAGVAAAVAVQRGLLPSQAPVQEVQDELTRQGARIH